ncbi:hypothetical protein BH23CHL5_BH23CHL5_28690 [soil metagenome]
MTDEVESDVVESRMAQILAVVKRDLGDEEREQLRARIAASIKLGQEIRSRSLQNSDEPEIVFLPWRSSERVQ